MSQTVFQRGETQTFPATLTVINCGECGGIYAINERYRQGQEQVGGSWHCPYCECGWGYAHNSENERLKRDLQLKEAELTRQLQRLDQTKAALRETESRRRAEKGAKTKLKKRAASGICPCCNRYFVEVHKHMLSQHPEFVDEAKAETAEPPPKDTPCN